jgi:hypothetical protein
MAGDGKGARADNRTTLTNQGCVTIETESAALHAERSRYSSARRYQTLSIAGVTVFCAATGLKSGSDSGGSALGFTGRAVLSAAFSVAGGDHSAAI